MPPGPEVIKGKGGELNQSKKEMVQAWGWCRKWLGNTGKKKGTRLDISYTTSKESGHCPTDARKQGGADFVRRLQKHSAGLSREGRGSSQGHRGVPTHQCVRGNRAELRQDKGTERRGCRRNSLWNWM